MDISKSNFINVTYVQYSVCKKNVNQNKKITPTSYSKSQFMIQF